MTLKDVIRLFPPNEGYSMHLHWARDDGKEIDKSIDQALKRYKEHSLSFWFDSKQEMVNCMNGCDLYVSPRLYEGIGMGFLDAMAYGLVPVAFDTPTHNEYISNGYNGILFDSNLIDIKIDCVEIANIRSNMDEYMVNGRNLFEAAESDLENYLLSYMRSSSLTCVESQYPFDDSIPLSDVYKDGHQTFSKTICGWKESRKTSLVDIICHPLGAESIDGIKDMLKAIELNPSDTRVHLYAAASLVRIARCNDGLAKLRLLSIEVKRSLFILNKNSGVLEDPIGARAILRLEELMESHKAI